MPIHPVLVLFDLDGTLLTTEGAGRRAMSAAASQLFGRDFTFDKVEFAGRLDPLIFSEAASQNGLADAVIHSPEFLHQYLIELRIELQRDGQAKSLPGIGALLERLKRRQEARGDILLGLLTGNFEAAAPLKLEAAGLDRHWFTITAFGNQASSRNALARLAIERFGCCIGERPDPTRVVIVGDTPEDIRCARSNGCFAFAVATGPFRPHDLQEADIVVRNLSDPEPLLTLINHCAGGLTANAKVSRNIEGIKG